MTVIVLSKYFDKVNHNLLLAKLHAYGFGKQDVLINSGYLSNQKQSIKTNNAFSYWKDLIQDVP